MRDDSIYYNVGAMLYCPANNKAILHNLMNNKFGNNFSLIFCLEDSINDNMVEEAESILIDTIKALYKLSLNEDFYVPMIFIRVRNYNQITNLVEKLGEANSIIYGFNIPKISNINFEVYINAVLRADKIADKKFWCLPILEDKSFIDLRQRYNVLYNLKENFDSVEDRILNISVGANDLCNHFGVRRHSYESIYDIKPVAQILTDIITIFNEKYIIYGAVWEYYNGENWKDGLRNEIKLDRLSGFDGKLLIHPKQITVYNSASKVLREDYEDAKSILCWDKLDDKYVSGSYNNSRMNEYKTHCNWAKRIINLAKKYGVY